MPLKNLLQKIDLTNPGQLQTLVENRRVFNLDNCELNVFESYEQAFGIPLTFGDFIITSMVRGKKIMHLDNKPAFDYLPGETVVVPANETMMIDFPEATEANPTQCIALAIDASYINETVNYLNQYHNVNKQNNNWNLRFNQYHFTNDTEMSDLINKIIRICTSSNTTKNILADLNLKELLIRLLQSQQLEQVYTESKTNSNHSREHFVLNYIQEHLCEKIHVATLSRKAYLSRTIFFKWFKEQFGTTPSEYINRERIKLAKQLLTNPEHNVHTVSTMTGFIDANYFIRVFRKLEGVTPKTYKDCLEN
ncbi:AraC family transcriptional regulator [Danxiaibacter flavus]|uniref:AraC family transcriptional regulator n=1 Tax=Danxiaibacter flavus TaxID=3049108 RepID=A0ABV3ZHX7_9BACT|nr:AraC family transcriptional regulator [Chitinophagaceae bacterium DXS]